jgi:hypothetical protein
MSSSLRWVSKFNQSESILKYMNEAEVRVGRLNFLFCRSWNKTVISKVRERFGVLQNSQTNKGRMMKAEGVTTGHPPLKGNSGGSESLFEHFPQQRILKIIFICNGLFTLSPMVLVEDSCFPPPERNAKVKQSNFLFYITYMYRR